MKRYLFGVIGLAVFTASSLIGQTPALGGGCVAEGSGCAEAGCGCGGCCKCGDCGGGMHSCCPRCGCQLQPVCNITCGTKKTTDHEYCCKCKDICIPPVTPPSLCCRGCNDCCDNNCKEGCGCCRVREIHKLTVHTVTKEHPVKECTVTWTCPSCGGCYGGCGETGAPAPNVAPTGPAPAAPAPAPTHRLPPPPKTTNTVPAPEDIHTARTGF